MIMMTLLFLILFFSVFGKLASFAFRATWICEAGVNIKVIQEIMGHSDITTTLDIYTDATSDFKKKEMLSFEEFINKKDTED